MRASRSYLPGKLATVVNNELLLRELELTESGFPVIHPETYVECTWIGFNSARTCLEKAGHGVHFFLDDYQFERVWDRLEVNTRNLDGFDVVASPDWSLYRDTHVRLQQWNHYRNNAVGAFWQQMGLHVFPTVAWSDESSYEWCFDGLPVGGVVMVSSVGTQAEAESRKLFLKGYDAMMERLQPAVVIFYGKVPDGCRGNIVRVKSWTERMKERERGLE